MLVVDVVGLGCNRYMCCITNTIQCASHCYKVVFALFRNTMSSLTITSEANWQQFFYYFGGISPIESIQ